MTEALYEGVVIAQSNETVLVEGNYYFPPSSVNMEYLQNSSTQSTCPWKGLASYFDVVVEGKVVRDAAWYYPSPKEAAKQITGFVAFWKEVQVVE